jgi:hypothetical protein
MDEVEPSGVYSAVSALTSAIHSLRVRDIELNPGASVSIACSASLPTLSAGREEGKFSRDNRNINKIKDLIPDRTPSPAARMCLFSNGSQPLECHFARLRLG